MSSIDNRIVNMVFNNKGFESGVATTLNSLKKLNESLKMKDTGKGLDEVSKGITKLNNSGLTGLGSGVDTVTAKFSALGVMAATALSNITNKAVNVGTALVKSFTIDPIKTGFDEYETKINAIQTILSNTAHQGTTLSQVTNALNELNTYADKTIYNFAQMTENIGRFTAAGVDLDTSVESIKGIANLAAASGSTPAQASAAMYQLSQAIAAGKVSLQDWNSVVNAGMGGKLFQDALKETAKQMGINVDESKSFRDSLQDGWMTAEVMTKTLQKFANDPSMMKAATEVKTLTGMIDAMKESVQSGWAQSWEFIIGDKDQATKLLTSISDAFNDVVTPISNARNEMLKFWNQNGGRDAVIKGLGNAFGSLGKVLGSVRDGFRDVFPAMTGEKLVALSKGFEKFTEKLKVSDKTAAKIKDTFKGLFSVVDFVKTGVVNLFKAFAPGVGIFGGISDIILTATSSFGKFLTKINESAKASNIFGKLSDGIRNGLTSIGNMFQNIGKGFSAFIDQISNLNFKPMFEFMGKVGSGLGKGVVDVLSGIGKAIGNINLNTILGGIVALAGKGAFDKLAGIFENFSSAAKDLSGFGSKIKGVLDSVRETLEAYQQNLNASTLIKVASAIGILATSLALLSGINASDLNNALSGITVLFLELAGAMAFLMKINVSKGLFKMAGISTALIALGSAILILSFAVKNMSGLNWQELATGLVGIAGSMLVLAGAAKLISGAGKGMISTSTGLILFSTALLVMSQAVKKFSEINPNNMVVGLMGVAAVMAELAAFMKVTDLSSMGIRSGTGILLLASAMLVLQDAVSKFGNMNVDKLIQGLSGMGVLLAEIAAFSNLSGSAGKLLVTAAAMAVMGASLHVLSSAIRSMAGMQWDDMARGLITLAGGLTIIGTATKLMSGAKLATVGAGLLVTSSALLVMGSAIKSLSSMGWEEIGRGLVALAGGLTVLGVAMYAITGSIAGAGALLVVSAAMAIFTPQLIAMSNLSWGQIAAGLATLAGALSVIGVAGLLITPVVPGLIGLAGAVVLLGAGCLAAGAGVSALATGLALLATTGAAGGLAFIEIVRQLINLLPQLGTKMGEAIVNMAKAIGEGIPQIVVAFGQLITGIAQAVTTYAPQIIQIGLQLVTSLCNVIAQSVPQMVTAATTMILALLNTLASNAGNFAIAAVDLIVNFINGLASKVGEVIQAGIDLAISVIDGLADGIQQNAPRVGEALGNLIKAAIDAIPAMIGGAMTSLGGSTVVQFVGGILGKIGDAVSAAGQLASRTVAGIKSKVGQFLSAGGQLITSLVSGIRGKIGSVVTAVGNGISQAVNAVRSKVGQFLSAGGQLMSNLVSGIRGKVSAVTSAVSSAVQGAVNAAKSKVSAMVNAGMNLMQGFINGIKSKASAIASAAKNVVSNAVSSAKRALGIHSPSRVFAEIGRYTAMGMAQGLKRNATLVNAPATSLADNAINSVRNTITKIADVMNADMDYNPTIKPVMDLSNIQQGSKTIGQLINDHNGLAIQANASGMMTRTMGKVQNGTGNADVVSALKDLSDTMNNSSGGNTYQINGITYDDGSNVRDAVETLIRASLIERRI